MATEQKKPPIDWGKPILRRQSTDCREPEAVRNATPDEVRRSRDAGFEGYIHVPGVGTCFVEE